MNTYVIKADNTREEFSKKKIIKTCINSGTTKQEAEKIAKTIEKKISSGTTTHKIYKLILFELKRRKDLSSFIYRLRESISEIAPEIFEKYIKKVLELHGYQCEWNKIIKGACVEHQVDLIAKENKKNFLVEVKRHENLHRFTGLGTALQVFARLEDIKDGFKKGINNYNFYTAWIITNTKFSEHAKKFCKAKNIFLSGWRYKNDIALNHLIQTKKIYPVTIFYTDQKIKNKLMSAGIITLQDFIKTENKQQVEKITGKNYYNLASQTQKLIS